MSNKILDFINLPEPSLWQWLLLLFAMTIGALSLRQIYQNRHKYKTRHNRLAVSAACIVLLALMGLIMKPEYRAGKESVVTVHLPDADSSLTTATGPQLTLGYHPDFPQLETVMTLPALHRLYPQIARLDINGTHLPEAGFAGLSVDTIKAMQAKPEVGISQLRWDRQVTHGQTVNISGVYHFTGAPLAELRLRDIADETLATEVLKPGEAFEFSLIAKATGQVQYQIIDAQERTVADLHLYVEKGIKQQALLWASSPNAEFNGLKKWLLAQQQDVISEYDISEGKTLVQKSVTSLVRDNSDVIVMDGRKLARLGQNELSRLQEGIEAGTGLILIADDSLQEVTWLRELGITLTPYDVPRKNMQTFALDDYQFDAGVNIRSLRFTETSGGKTLLRDADGRAMAIQQNLGKGSVVITLIPDSFVLNRQQQVTDYGVYWQTLLSAAKPLTSRSRFIPQEPDNVVYIGSRIKVCSLSAASKVQTAILHAGEQGTLEQFKIPMTSTPHREALKCGYFWPTHGGWHQLRLMDNDNNSLAETAIYVYQPHAFKDVRVHALHAAIDHYNGQKSSIEQSQSASYKPVPAWWFALLWLSGAGFLWWRKR
ncbi:DUF7408 domain-containing protein [Planctobacterium marinum]